MKQYWRYLKNLSGIEKKQERLPETVQMGEGGKWRKEKRGLE